MGALVLFEAPHLIGGVGAQVTGQRPGPRLPLQMGALVLFEVPRSIGGVAALVTGQGLGRAQAPANGCAVHLHHRSPGEPQKAPAHPFARGGASQAAVL